MYTTTHFSCTYVLQLRYGQTDCRKILIFEGNPVLQQPSGYDYTLNIALDNAIFIYNAPNPSLNILL